MHIETTYIILSKQRITKALIRLRGCAGWSVSLLFAYGKNRFSHDIAQLLCLNGVHSVQNAYYKQNNQSVCGKSPKHQTSFLGIK